MIGKNLLNKKKYKTKPVINVLITKEDYIKFKKQEEILDKIKEYIKEYKNCVPKHISDYILELLEEIK